MGQNAESPIFIFLVLTEQHRGIRAAEAERACAGRGRERGPQRSSSLARRPGGGHPRSKSSLHKPRASAKAAPEQPSRGLKRRGVIFAKRRDASGVYRHVLLEFLPFLFVLICKMLQDVANFEC